MHSEPDMNHADIRNTSLFQGEASKQQFGANFDNTLDELCNNVPINGSTRFAPTPSVMGGIKR